MPTSYVFYFNYDFVADFETFFFYLPAPESINCNFEHVSLCGYLIDETTGFKWNRVNSNELNKINAPTGGIFFILSIFSTVF